MYLRWVGGKSRLVRTLLRYIPRHRTYVEAFCGAAWLFWSKQPSRVEVINDIDSRLIRFYTVLRDISDLKSVIDKYGWVYGRSEQEVRNMFERAKTIISNHERYDDDEFLWAFLLVNKFGYSGMMSNSRFNPRRYRDCVSPYCGIIGLINDFSKVKKRFRNTIILNKDYSEVIMEFDAPDTFFYLDPPYFQTGEKDGYLSNVNGSTPYPKEVFKLLSEVRGKFLLSYNDHPTIRKFAKKYNFRVIEVETVYEMGRDSRSKSKVSELLIMNYKKQRSLIDFI